MREVQASAGTKTKSNVPYYAMPIYDQLLQTRKQTYEKSLQASESLPPDVYDFEVVPKLPKGTLRARTQAEKRSDDHWDGRGMSAESNARDMKYESTPKKSWWNWGGKTRKKSRKSKVSKNHKSKRSLPKIKSDHKTQLDDVRIAEGVFMVRS
jgi:hypothetical protein